MTGNERLSLASLRFPHGSPTVNLYTVFLLVMRGEIPANKRDDVIAENSKLQLENDEDDGKHRKRHRPKS